MSACETGAAVVRLVDKTGSVVAAGPGGEAHSAASVCLVGEPTFAAVRSELGTSSAAVAELVYEPCSFAAKPVGEA